MNPYTVLGVSETVSDEELKKAYRTKCKQYHPDLNPGSAFAEEKFKEVQTAYQEILDIKAGKRPPYGAHSNNGTHSYHANWQSPYGQNQSYYQQSYGYGQNDFRRNYYSQQNTTQQNPYTRRPPAPQFNIFRILFFIWAFRIVINIVSALFRGLFFWA